jgi:hypothetical protein
MNKDRLEQIYKVDGIDTIIKICLKKDEMIEGLQKMLEGQHYAGQLWIGDKNYNIYIKEE